MSIPSSSPQTKLTSCTRGNRCPVCGGYQRCSIGADGLLCCHQKQGEQPGFVCLGAAKKDNSFTLYRRVDDPVLAQRTEAYRASQQQSNGVDWAQMAEGYRAALTPERHDGLAALLGLPPSVIGGLGIGWDEAAHCWTIPEVDGAGRVIGVGLRRPDGGKFQKSGGRRGLLAPQGWRDRDGAIFLPEGASNVLALTALGLSAIGRPNNRAGGEHLAELLSPVAADRQIVVVGDYDPKPTGAWPGLDGAKSVAGQLSEKLSRKVYYVLPPDGVKDVRQWVNGQGLGLPTNCADSWHEAGERLSADLLARCKEAEIDPRSYAANGKPPAPPSSNPASAAGEPHLTDLGNARRLVAGHRDDLRYCATWGKWLVWDGCRWALDASGEIMRRAKRTVEALFVEALAKGETERQLLLKHAFASERSSRLKAMIELAASEAEMPIRLNNLDADPQLLNCTNGTIDLRTGKLRQHRRQDFLTRLAPVAYRPDAVCPRWQQFLGAVFADADEEPDKEMIAFVQRLLGRCLSADISEQILPIFWGSGSNGKSTLINSILDVLGPDYAMKARAELLMERGNDQHPTEMADLFGKRLIVASETPQGRRLNEALAKDLTGGEPIRARRMREDFWEFLPTHKIILLTNHRPGVRGTDEGIWRRLRLIPFTATFWDANDPNKEVSRLPAHLKQDKLLGAKLRAEREGILAWLVRGCLDWEGQGLGIPPAVRAATTVYRADEDAIGSWIAECCLTGDASYRGRSSVLYGSYHKWCENVGERAVSAKIFGPQLEEKGFAKKTSDGVWYLRIALRTD